MNSSIISKSYNIFAMICCLGITLLAVFISVFPIDGYFIAPPYNEEKRILRDILLVGLGILMSIPPPIALIGYYLEGGIGKKWFSHIIFGLLVLSLGLILLMILYLVYVGITIVPAEGMFETNISLDVVKLLIGFSVFTNFIIFPVTSAIIAFVVQKVGLWKRFLPLIAFISYFIIAVILTIIIVAIGYITKLETIYRGVQDATLPQFLMLGSVTWALIGLVMFWKNKNKDLEAESV